MRVGLVGDVSCGEHFFCFGHGPRSVVERGGDLFEYVRPLLDEMDLVVLNLEGPLSDLGLDSMDPLSRVFRGHPNSAEQLRFSGSTVASLANNHSVQHGVDCFRDTATRLEDAGVAVAGVGRVLQGTVIRSSSGERLCILAASEVPEAYLPEQIEYTVLDRTLLLGEVARRSDAGEIVVVSLHWGQEGSLERSEDQACYARELVDAGARIVAGHHPHVLLACDRTDEATVAYSLGNFVFDLPWDPRLRRSAILDVDLAQAGEPDRVRLWPIRLDSDGRPRLDGEPQTVTDSGIDPYPRGGRFKWEAWRKSSYFVRYLGRGNTGLKLRFVLRKLQGYGRR